MGRGRVGFSAPARIVSTHTHKYKIDVSGEGGGNRLGLGGSSPLQRFAARFVRLLFRFFSFLANLSLLDKTFCVFTTKLLAVLVPRNGTTSATLPVLR